MQVTFVKVGKVAKEFQELSEHYFKRLKPYANVDFKLLKQTSAVQQLLKESQATPSSLSVLLDERGKMMSSTELAHTLQTQRENTIRSFYFFIGPPYGWSDEDRKRAGVLLSLTPMVLPSDLALLVTAEQVYRAYSILNGSPYHHA